MNIGKKQVSLVLKGFAMGIADIVPGVSGGTIAFITGIYDDLLASISSVDKKFISYLLKFEIKNALNHINASFLIPLLIGITFAIISMSKVMHFFMHSYPIYTWSLFFGLIAASIRYIGKQIQNRSNPKNTITTACGAIIAALVVSLIPVETPTSNIYIFGSGMIAICAMILPGISGSFILLILGKYAFVTGAVKAPFATGSLPIIIVFASGCLIGLLSFSKVLNWLLKNYHNLMMCFLTGFMIGSMKKIWPWKQTLESKVIRGKIYILKEANILPSSLDQTVIVAIILMLVGFSLVLLLDKIANKK
jgi:putative membrane protein